MQTQAIKIIEPEVVLEEARSANHSRLIHRIYVAPLPYEDHYDSYTGIRAGCQPLQAQRSLDNQAGLYDQEQDIVRYLNPPITAIEIISSTQSMDGLMTKIR